MLSGTNHRRVGGAGRTDRRAGDAEGSRPQGEPPRLRTPMRLGGTGVTVCGRPTAGWARGAAGLSALPPPPVVRNARAPSSRGPRRTAAHARRWATQRTALPSSTLPQRTAISRPSRRASAHRPRAFCGCDAWRAEPARRRRGRQREEFVWVSCRYIPFVLCNNRQSHSPRTRGPMCTPCKHPSRPLHRARTLA
jgi:hypothetical protein